MHGITVCLDRRWDPK